MNRFLPAALALSVLLAAPALGQEVAKSDGHNAPLRDQLPAEGYSHYEPGKQPKYNDGVFELNQFPGWFKPLGHGKTYKGESRLVLKLTGDGKAILNPKNEGEFSHHTIPLDGLDPANAEALWGEPRKATDGTLTFDLISRNRRPEQDVYHIDMRFKDGKLASYRVRGIGILLPEWTSII